MLVRFSAALVVFLVLVFFAALSFGLAWWASTGEFWAASSPEERGIVPPPQQPQRVAVEAERGAETTPASTHE
ncbi:MAG TPA: hypothetical protein VLJ14_01020 [Ktedonobacterales bacterium]|jgi:hypothetical protein|nr:hypothetical protein [Ktedonobacterales bacterium]